VRDSAARLQLLNERLQSAGFLPPHADVAKARGLLRVFVANSTIRYAPIDTQPVPIVLFRAAEAHPDYDFSSADDAGVPIAQSTMGWRKYARGPVEVHLVPGNHISMMSQPHVGLLADKINTCLQKGTQQ